MIWIIVLAILIIALVFYVLGPRVKIDDTVNKIKLPEKLEALDSYLNEKESAVENLIPGTEKMIIWATGKKIQTEYSIIYFHGFSTSRQEISPVTETIGKKLNANIFFTRLRHHGINDDDALGKASVNDWINDAWEAYEMASRIGKKIIFISTSAGSPLALWLCLNQEKNNIIANIMLSPMFGPKDQKLNVLLLPWSKQLVPLFFGKYIIVTPIDESHRGFMSCTYPSTALITAIGLCKMATGLKYQNINVPSLCLYNENDDVVSVPIMKKVLKNTDPKLLMMEPITAKYHCIVGDAISPENNDLVINKILKFLDEI